jgi:glycosyltransferase involved in cell wall biosynthesis
MSPSIRNLWLTAKLVNDHNLVIISGSWSFLNIFAVYMGLLCGTPVITFVTMNSTAAVDANFSGAMWYLSYVLYMATDYFNCWFSMGAWTRSAEYLRVLSARYIPVQGVVYCGDQYKTFQIQDSHAEIHEARQILSGGQLQRPVLLYCGRLLPEKRIPLLVAAKPEGVSLAIVGTGSEAEWLRSIHDPTKGIVCLVDGMVSQESLRKYYRAADIHISASDFETLGNTVHEALLCGCPVVVQRAGGYMSQVADEKMATWWIGPMCKKLRQLSQAFSRKNLLTSSHCLASLPMHRKLSSLMSQSQCS